MYLTLLITLSVLSTATVDSVTVKPGMVTTGIGKSSHRAVEESKFVSSHKLSSQSQTTFLHHNHVTNQKNKNIFSLPSKGIAHSKLKLKVISHSNNEKKKMTSSAKHGELHKSRQIRIRPKTILISKEKKQKVKNLQKPRNPFDRESLKVLHFFQDRKEIDAVMQVKNRPDNIPRHKHNLKSIFYDDEELDVVALLKKLHKYSKLSEETSDSQEDVLRLLHSFKRGDEGDHFRSPRKLNTKRKSIQNTKKIEIVAARQYPKPHKMVSHPKTKAIRIVYKKKGEDKCKTHSKNSHGKNPHSKIHIHMNGGKLKVVKSKKINSPRQLTTMSIAGKTSVSAKNTPFQ